MSKKINIISPFGPKLAKIKLSKKVVNDINQEVERIILNEKKSKKKDYSKKLVGEVYQEIELSKNFINKKLKKFIHEKVKKYLKSTINKSTNKKKVKGQLLFENFDEQSFLIPELRKAQYLLKIEGGGFGIDNLLKKLNEIDNVISSYRTEISSIKSKYNLIFE